MCFTQSPGWQGRLRDGCHTDRATFPGAPGARIVAMQSTPTRLRRATVGLLLAGALALAACSSETATSGPATSSTLPLSTLPATLAPTTPPSTIPATTTTEAPKPKYPLTGLEATDAAVAARPAMVAKIGNYDRHPQTGLNEADIVFEEIINDHITRFAAVYHSTTPANFVGPIRSGRRQDVNLLTSLNHPVLAWAGGNAFVTNEIDDSTLVNMNMTHCNGACFRVDFDQSPYNLYFDIAKAWTVAPEGGLTPPPQFQYRAPDGAVQGTPATRADMTLDSYKIGWTWNAATGLYEREQNKKADTERSGEVVTTNNVLVLVMVYKSGLGSPDAQSIGDGEAYLFTAGTIVHGTWSRADSVSPFTLTTDAGETMLLTPGRTFIELPRDKDTITFS